MFEDPEQYYSTFNFHYPPKPFDRLSALSEFNTLLGEQTIKDVIADCVKKRREGKTMNGAHVNGAHVNGAHVNGAHVNGAHVNGMKNGHK